MKYLMCIYGGHICICIPNMKFLCLTLWQGKVCTDDDANDDDTNTNDNRQSMIEGSLADKRNEPKTKKTKMALDSFDTSTEQPSVCNKTTCNTIVTN